MAENGDFWELFSGLLPPHTNIMAELAAAATIVQLVQFSGVILTSCYDYISKAKTASGDIEKVINDVSGLEGILKRLHSLISDGENERHAILKSLNGPFQACSQALKELQKRLDILTEASSARRKLLWPLEEKKILEILGRLGGQKQIFILALAGDHAFSDEANAKQGKEAIDKLNEMKIREERNKILNWLAGADPSTNYNTARKKHEKGTGDWLLQSEQFQTWKDADSHIMWLYGIPGAGKTILRFVSPRDRRTYLTFLEAPPSSTISRLNTILDPATALPTTTSTSMISANKRRSAV